MRIERLEAIPVAIPFTHDGPDAGFAGGTWRTADYLLVRISTADGPIGYGEAFGYGVIPGTKAVLERTLAPLVIGEDARDITGLLGRLERTLHVFGRGGCLQYALSGIEIALWDIAGKEAGQPLWRLLGGSPRAAVPAYASFLRLFEPEHSWRACAAAAEKGLTGIKLHDVRIDTIMAAREAIGERVALMVDVNCAWSRAEAIEAARALEPARLAWLEEPVWPPEDLDAFASVRSAADVPLAAGENAANPWAFKALSRCPGLDILQPSVTKVGGVNAFLQAARLTQLEGRQVTPHSPYYGPGLLATLQLAAILPDMDWVEHFAVELEAPLYGGIELPDADGNIAIPQGPGLGADPDPELLERYRCDR